MKWTEEKIKELKDLCYRGVPNKDLAQHFRCNLNQIYAKRSQLGITIDKVKAKKRAQQQPKWRINSGVKLAFESLQSALLIAMATNNTPMEIVKLYSDASSTISDLQRALEQAVGEVTECD